jgi:hypothetical protein
MVATKGFRSPSVTLAIEGMKVLSCHSTLDATFSFQFDRGRSAAAATSCVDCAAGIYSAGPAIVSCTSCGAGAFSASRLLGRASRTGRELYIKSWYPRRSKLKHSYTY